MCCPKVLILSESFDPVLKFNFIRVSNKTHAASLSRMSFIKHIDLIPQAQTLKQLAAEPEGAGLSDLHHCGGGQAAVWAQHGPGGLHAGDHLVQGVGINYSFMIGWRHQEMDISQGVYQLSIL